MLPGPDADAPEPTGRRSLLVVCAHPDDETIHVGGTLARYAAPGARGGLRHGDRTYRTQVPPTDALLELSAEELGQLSSTEDLTLRVGSAAVDPEDDLFAGIGDDGPAAAP